MKRHTKSILEELNDIGNDYDRQHLIASRGANVIASVTNLVTLIQETYDENTSNDLVKRLLNSIRTDDPTKFKRGINKANESKRHSGSQ